MATSEPERPSKSERKIDVLVITTQYAPDFGPSAPIYTALCEDLQRLGCNVTVITAFPHYANAGTLYPRPQKWFQEDSLNGVRILRTYIHTVPKSSLWRRLLYHASFNLSSTLALLKVKKPDIVLADAPTLCSGLALLFRSFLGRVPFIYIVQDIYPDVLSRLGVLNNPVLLKLIAKVEYWIYSKASWISVLSQGFKDNLIQKGVPAGKIKVIPVSVDVDFIKPLTQEGNLYSQWGLEKKFVVLYAGNIGFSQGLETVIQAANRLCTYPDIAFVIVGDGSMKGPLMEMTQKLGLTNVKIYPFQPREKIPEIYALADISLVPLKRNIVVESVPSKTYSIMASGRPLIAAVDKKTEIGLLAEQVHCGLRVDPEDATALSEAIIQLHEDASLRQEMGRKGREYIEKECSRFAAAKEHFALIQKVIGKTA